MDCAAIVAPATQARKSLCQRRLRALCVRFQTFGSTEWEEGKVNTRAKARTGRVFRDQGDMHKHLSQKDTRSSRRAFQRLTNVVLRPG